MAHARWSILATLAAAFAAGCASPAHQAAKPDAPFENFESPYFIFQYAKGENWIDSRSVFAQALEGHFGYMASLEEDGVLIYGGPIDRGDGADVFGVLRARDLAEARSLISADPALSSQIYTLNSVDRWIAVAGSGDGIDRSLIRPVSP